jgi:tetratricopeptide (TPR) repeat protein
MLHFINRSKNREIAMSFTALAATLLLSQAAVSAAPATPLNDRIDVAYTELSSGQAGAAVSKLEASGATKSEDPATLINLGSAYAANGQTEKALATYRAAVASSDRYDLQLADGSWVDSRAAARLALNNLLRTTARASR